MPVAYKSGILESIFSDEAPLCGLFDISHMGRFTPFAGKDAACSAHVLTNNALAWIRNGPVHGGSERNSGALDDAYLYRLKTKGPSPAADYLLVVNAANRRKDWGLVMEHAKAFKDLTFKTEAKRFGMLACRARSPRRSWKNPPERNTVVYPTPVEKPPEGLRTGRDHVPIITSRTVTRANPSVSNFFLPADKLRPLWKRLLAEATWTGSCVGLGARDTLRLGGRTLPLRARTGA